MRYLEAGVEDGILGGKFAVAFDFGRAVVVAIHAPVRNVAMMADPVEQLSAAGVVIPAPVFVDARPNVRFHSRRAEPHVVIQFRRRVTDGEVPCLGGVRADFCKTANACPAAH